MVSDMGTQSARRNGALIMVGFVQDRVVLLLVSIVTIDWMLEANCSQYVKGRDHPAQRFTSYVATISTRPSG
jgi:hypothetical protein